MPCWSVLESGVSFGAVDPRVLRLAAQAVGYVVEVTPAGIRLVEAGADVLRGSLWIRADGRMEFAARYPMVWGGVSYDVQTEAGKIALSLAVKRAVMVQAVRVAAMRVGAVVVATGASTGRVTLKGGG